MNRTRLFLGTAVLLAILAAVIVPTGTPAFAQKKGGGGNTPPPPPAPSYSLYLLENNLGGVWSKLGDINNLGDATGTAGNAAGGTSSIVSTPETRAAGVDMVDLQSLLIAEGYSILPSLPDVQRHGWFSLSLIGINDDRVIAGRAVYFDNGIHMGQRFFRMALSIAENGEVGIDSIDGLPLPWETNGIAGHSFNNDGDILALASLPDPNGPNGTSWQLVVYSPELGWTNLGLTPETTLPLRTSDRDASGSMFIVMTENGGKRLTYNIPTGTITNTVTLVGTYKQNPTAQPGNVNDLGHVCGSIRTGREDYRASLYIDGVMLNLGNLTSASGWNDSWANAVNNTGTVVGMSMMGTAPVNSGLLYVASNSTTYDAANTLSSAQRTAYTSLVARGLADINDSDVICGPASDIALADSESRAFLLVPAAP
jgi:hypothetical protein